MADWMRDLEDFPALPRLMYSTVSDFYQGLREALEEKTAPVWQGELYLELHRGTLTTQGRTKYLHRRAEGDLIAAEVLSSLTVLAGGESVSGLHSAWKLLLRNQFHDILPGSSIREVYERANDELRTAISDARSRMDDRLAALARLVVTPGDQPGLFWSIRTWQPVRYASSRPRSCPGRRRWTAAAYWPAGS